MITGASGFIGTRVVALLNRELGDEENGGVPQLPGMVHVLVRATSDLMPLAQASRNLRVNDRVRFCFSDLGSLEDLRRVVSPQTTVVLHVAAQGGDWGRRGDFVTANETGTENLIRVLREQCPRLRRFVHVSTVDVYPHALRPAQCSEEVAPVTDSHYPYTVTKAESERIVMRSGLPEWCILRPAVVYGPRSYSWGYQEAQILARGGGVFIDGSNYRSGAVYVDDVADAIVRAARAPVERIQGKIMNLADPQGAGTWKEFYDRISDALGRPRVRWSVPRWLALALAWLLESLYTLCRWYDERPFFTFFLLRLIGQDQDWPIEAAHEALGWKPSMPFEVGMHATTEWLREVVLPSSDLQLPVVGAEQMQDAGQTTKDE